MRWSLGRVDNAEFFFSIGVLVLEGCRTKVEWEREGSRGVLFVGAVCGGE